MTLPEMLSSVTKPRILLDEAKVEQHIVAMVRKVGTQAKLRPHFKTHQSAGIGEYFREQGVKAISVSSVSMATYFADNGWSDILITLPVNPREVQAINSLAHRVTLHILVESVEAVMALNNALDHQVNAWIEVDTGSNRTGIDWRDGDSFHSLIATITQAQHLTLTGMLTYAGKTYTARNTQEVASIYHEAFDHLVQARQRVEGQHALKLSVGDTPSCSVLDSFEGVDELRPGNFVFYDLMQMQIGACTMDDIAIAVACPIIAKQEGLGQFVIYGGAAHFSKDSVLINDRHTYGQLALFNEHGWVPVPSGRLVKLSQEHGVITVDRDTLNALQVGQLVAVLPAHACLTADLYGRYLTLDGRVVPKMRTNG